VSDKMLEKQGEGEEAIGLSIHPHPVEAGFERILTRTTRVQHSLSKNTAGCSSTPRMNKDIKRRYVKQGLSHAGVGPTEYTRYSSAVFQLVFYRESK